MARRVIFESTLLAQKAIHLAMEAARMIIKPKIQKIIVRITALPDELDEPTPTDTRRQYYISSLRISAHWLLCSTRGVMEMI